MQKKVNIGFHNGFTLTAADFTPEVPQDADFWRIYLDYCQPGWQKHLNYTFVCGMRFDSAIYRCRVSLKKAPAYGEHMKKLVALREAYLDFLLDGKFDLPRQKLGDKVWGAEYTLHGETIITLWNDGKEDFTMPYGKEAGTVVKPGEVKVLHV